jgi:dTDP-4-dehydrorhamnose reductase
MFVTGAHGLLGREIADFFRGEYEIRATDRDECDVMIPEELDKSIGDFAPDVVVHCAAYTAVDRAETDEAAAVSLNAAGTRNVARVCRDIGCLLVTYGSDYIFDGSSSRPYREDDAARPLSAYGRSKLLAEKALAEENPRFLLIRSQWLFGAHGRNFVSTVIDKARRGDPLRIVTDQTGTPTYTRDLAFATKLLIDAGAQGTFHFSNAGETNWFEFAAYAIARSGQRPASLSPARTGDLAYPAPRPAYSVLSKEKYIRVTGVPPRSWEDAVAEFLTDRRDA